MDIDIMAIVKQKAEEVEAKRLEAIQKHDERMAAIATSYRRIVVRMDELQAKLSPLLTLRVKYKYHGDTATSALGFVRKDSGPGSNEKAVGMAILFLAAKEAVMGIDISRTDQKEFCNKSICRVIMRDPNTEACEVYVHGSTPTSVLCMDDAIKRIASEVGAIVVPDEALVQKVKEEKIKRKPRGRSIVIPGEDSHNV